MGKQRIIIVGAGTFACNVISYLEADKKTRWEIAGLTDNKLGLCGKEVLGYKILGDDNCLQGLLKKGVRYAILGIGSTAGFDLSVRKSVFERVKKAGFQMTGVISDRAVVHSSVIKGEGVIIPDYVVVDPEVKIGDNVFLSPYVYLSHHVRLASHIFISSFVNFVGGVSVGGGTFVGMSATICKDVGGNCNIYPKTLVMETVEDNMVAFGNPMRKIQKSLFDVKGL